MSPPPAMSANRRRAGFSLLELLLAAALGALTTAAVAQLFVSNARASVVQTGQARLQESARLALHFLADSARSAGYFGCAPATLADGLGGTWRGDLAQDFARPVLGADDVGDAGDVRAWELGDRELKPGSDVVLFRRIEGRGHDLAQPFVADGELVVASSFATTSGGLAVLSACGRLGVLGIESIARRGAALRLRRPSDVDRSPPRGRLRGPAGPRTVLRGRGQRDLFIRSQAVQSTIESERAGRCGARPGGPTRWFREWMISRSCTGSTRRPMMPM